MGFKNKKNGRNVNDDLNLQQKQLKDLLLKKLPDKIVYEAQKLVDSSFQNETYQDGKSGKWKGRKNDKTAKMVRSERRAILVKYAELIQSVVANQRGRDIIISSDKVYAQIHNEGLEGNAFGKKKFKMEKRQFMPIPGEPTPQTLDDTIEAYLDKQMNDIFG